MGEQQPVNGVEARLRVLRVIWGAMLASVGLYAVLGFVLLPLFEPKNMEETEADVFLGPLLVLSLILIYASFSAKFGRLAEAADRRRLDEAQKAIFMGLALSEAAAFFGLVGIIITGNPLAFGIMAVGALVLLLHYPRREQLSGEGQPLREV